MRVKGNRPIESGMWVCFVDTCSQLINIFFSNKFHLIQSSNIYYHRTIYQCFTKSFFTDVYTLSKPNFCHRVIFTYIFLNFNLLENKERHLIAYCVKKRKTKKNKRNVTREQYVTYFKLMSNEIHFTDGTTVEFNALPSVKHGNSGHPSKNFNPTIFLQTISFHFIRYLCEFVWASTKRKYARFVCFTNRCG